MADIMNKKLLPCPMCDSKAIDYDMGNESCIFCISCGFSYDLFCQESSIKGWNDLGCRKRIAELERQLAERRRQYYILADTIAAGSVSFEHLNVIALMTREQRDEAACMDFTCRCGQCISFAHNELLCEYSRLPMMVEREVKDE